MCAFEICRHNQTIISFSRRGNVYILQNLVLYCRGLVVYIKLAKDEEAYTNGQNNCSLAMSAYVEGISLYILCSQRRLIVKNQHANSGRRVPF